MKQYLEQVRQIVDHGCMRGDRTGTGTLSLFGMQTRYDLRESFPLVTTKKINFSAVVKELLWFLRGETNINTLGCKIWDEWADFDGELGPIYGWQWRHWDTIREAEDISGPKLYTKKNDQIAELIQNLKENPESRRHIVSAWNVSDVPYMALPPCHTMFQCYASKINRFDRLNLALDSESRKFANEDEDKWDSVLDESNIPKYYLDLQLYQRSGDMMLGVKTCALLQ